MKQWIPFSRSQIIRIHQETYVRPVTRSLYPVTHSRMRWVHSLDPCLINVFDNTRISCSNPELYAVFWEVSHRSWNTGCFRKEYTILKCYTSLCIIYTSLNQLSLERWDLKCLFSCIHDIDTYTYSSASWRKFADWHLLIKKKMGQLSPNNESASWNNSLSQNLRYPPSGFSGRSVASVPLEEQLKKSSNNAKPKQLSRTWTKINLNGTGLEEVRQGLLRFIHYLDIKKHHRSEK